MNAFPARMTGAGEPPSVRPLSIDPECERSRTGPKSVLNPAASSSRPMIRASSWSDDMPPAAASPADGIGANSCRKRSVAPPSCEIPINAGISRPSEKRAVNRSVWSKVSRLRRDRTMPPGRITSNSSRVRRSGSWPWNPRKKSWPTFSSSANRLRSFIRPFPKIGEMFQRLDRCEVVNIQGPQRAS